MREDFYDALDPWSAETLAADSRNFELPRNEVLRSSFRRNRSWRTPMNFGRVDFELLGGGRRRLIILGPEDQEAVIALLKIFDRQLSVSGRYRPIHKPTPKTPEQKRRAERVSYVIFLLIGVFFLGFALSPAGKRKPEFATLMVATAAMNFVVGAHGLWRSVRRPAGEQDPPVAEELADKPPEP